MNILGSLNCSGNGRSTMRAKRLECGGRAKRRHRFWINQKLRAEERVSRFESAVDAALCQLCRRTPNASRNCKPRSIHATPRLAVPLPHLWNAF
jgi:hypothetical protein